MATKQVKPETEPPGSRPGKPDVSWTCPRSLVIPVQRANADEMRLSRWPRATGEDANVTTLGMLEVTAEIIEISGEFPSNKLYDYWAVWTNPAAAE